MTNRGRRALASVVGALMVTSGLAACSGGDDADAVGASTERVPGTTDKTVERVVAFVRPVAGGGAMVEYDDGTWACDTRSQFVSMGATGGGHDRSWPTAAAAALGDRDSAAVTVEKIGEQLDADAMDPHDAPVDLAAFALREGGELVAVAVVEDDGAGWRSSSTTSCD